jgi:hypothetical protein
MERKRDMIPTPLYVKAICWQGESQPNQPSPYQAYLIEQGRMGLRYMAPFSGTTDPGLVELYAQFVKGIMPSTSRLDR